MTGAKVVYRDFTDVLKHEARLKLWLPLLTQLKTQLRRPLRYFTLPGPLALDVERWGLEGLLEFSGRGYPSVCFCDHDVSSFANAKRVLGNTRGVYAQFEDIIMDSPDAAHKPFWDLFPYDAYNLDFCGSWFDGHDPLSRTFDAIVKLIDKHVRHTKSGPFLLFLTIRIDRARFHPKTFDDLKKNLADNSLHRDFAGIVKNLTGGDISSFADGNFRTFILTSIPKLVAFRSLPRSQRMMPAFLRLERLSYDRKGYSIGKFAFIIGKERANYRIYPDWYKALVIKSLNPSSVVTVKENAVGRATRDDLRELEAAVQRRVGYA